MKIQKEHYEYLKRAISHHLENRDAPSIITQYKRDGLTPKRFRWDVSYGAKLSPWIAENIYPYADDDHIDTALRRVMKEIHLPWAAQ